MSDMPHIHDFVCFSASGCPLERGDYEPSEQEFLSHYAADVTVPQPSEWESDRL
jgi:hypothetical protein